MKPIRRLAAALTLAALTLTGVLTAVDAVTTPADTTWGAPAADTPVCCRVSADGVDGTPVTPLDTTWG